MRLRDLPIIVKLLFAPVLLMSIMIAVTVVVHTSFNRTEQALNHLISSLRMATDLIADADSKATAAQAEMYRIVGLLNTVGDKALVREYVDAVLLDIDSVEADIRVFADIHEMTPEEVVAVEDVIQALGAFRESVRETMLALESEMPIAIMFIVGIEQTYDRLSRSIVRLAAIHTEENQAVYNEARAQTQRSRNLIQIMLAIAIVFGVALSYVAFRLISRPIVNMTSAMSHLAESGDTTVAVPGMGRRDEIGAMARALEVFRQSAVRINQLVKELQETQVFLRQVLDTIPVAVFWKDANLRYLGSNKAFDRDQLRESGRGTGAGADVALADTPIAKRRRELESRVLKEQVSLLNQEEQHPAPDGGMRWIRSSTVPMTGADGTVMGILGTYEDITQVKETERNLLQAQKMEVVGQLTGGIAHDFNNLLAIMMGNAELLEDRVKGDEKARQQIEKLLTTIDRASALTTRLLAFSRRQSLAPVAADVNALIEDLHELLSRTLGETIELKVATGTDVWPARIDPHQFENALINLAVNARDAMPSGGSMAIETANVALDEAFAPQDEEFTPGDYVVVTVSDTGAGMTEDVLEKAYEPFFTTKDVGKGSGLGLSMVYGFAKQSKGHVSIRSDVGLGTTVRLYLPRSAEAATAKEPDADIPVSPRGNESILVVEDDPSVREGPLGVLRDHGYDVVGAGGGEDAIAHLKSGKAFDLLFTDVVLPGGINGVDIAEQARRLQPRIKVLYTTGYAEYAVVHNGWLDTEATLLKKPYRHAELLMKVRKALSEGPTDT